MASFSCIILYVERDRSTSLRELPLIKYIINLNCRSLSVIRIHYLNAGLEPLAKTKAMIMIKKDRETKIEINSHK